MNFAVRIYRRLAQAFPHEFKLAYGAEVAQLGEDVVEDIAKRHGVTGLIRLIADIAMRVPLEYLSEMRRDMRYALRGLVKSPGFALVGVISIGLGIGLTTNVYNSKWQLIFRELPAAANAKRLVMLEKPVSYYYIEQYREQKSQFTGVAAFQTGIPFNVTFQGDMNAKPERVFGQLVSADYFSVLGVQPQRGRALSAELDRPGDAPVVVISDRFWRNRLNSSSDAVGQTLRLNGQPATIVGIASKNFNGALPIYVEFDQRGQADGSKTLPAILNESAARGFFGNGNAIGELVRDDKQSYEVVGVAHDLRNGIGISRSVIYLPLTRRNFARPPADGMTIMVRPDAGMDAGTDALSGIRREIAHIDPDLAIFNVRTLSDYLELSRSSTRFAVSTYGGIGVFGLVLAAIGLAGVTAYTVAQRRKEIGIRMALGARKGQALALVLREGAALVCVGTVLGFLGAMALAKILSAMTNIVVEALNVGTDDPRLLVGAPLLLAALAMLACYLPARRAAKIDPLKALREE
jgi:ABC-type antimicrobial peptide transport system permease subunit